MAYFRCSSAQHRRPGRLRGPRGDRPPGGDEGVGGSTGFVRRSRRPGPLRLRLGTRQDAPPAARPARHREHRAHPRLRHRRRHARRGRGAPRRRPHRVPDGAGLVARHDRRAGPAEARRRDRRGRRRADRLRPDRPADRSTPIRRSRPGRPPAANSNALGDLFRTRSRTRRRRRRRGSRLRGAARARRARRQDAQLRRGVGRRLHRHRRHRRRARRRDRLRPPRPARTRGRCGRGQTGARAGWNGWPKAFDPYGTLQWLAAPELDRRRACRGTRRRRPPRARAGPRKAAAGDLPGDVRHEDRPVAQLRRARRDEHQHTYQFPAGVTPSGNVRLGSHPDDHLLALFGERPAFLVTDPNTAGVYDTVYVDLDNDYRFDDEKPVTKASPASYRDMNGDGYTDLSGGLLYYISDGVTPIPGGARRLRRPGDTQSLRARRAAWPGPATTTRPSAATARSRRRTSSARA